VIARFQEETAAMRAEIAELRTKARRHFPAARVATAPSSCRYPEVCLERCSELFSPCCGPLLTGQVLLEAWACQSKPWHVLGMPADSMMEGANTSCMRAPAGARVPE
jgi:hypothetical protein